MSRPLRIEYAGAFYHVTSRGNERKAVYRSTPDREKFLFYLESATERYRAVIHVYCLMNNHYHLLLETPLGNLSQIMHHINGAYTTYFNTKHTRSGHLFQGRYKATLIDADEYASEVSRYIHLNPVRTGLVEIPEEYRWSSFQYYLFKREAPRWLNRDLVLGYFGREQKVAAKKYKDFVYSCMYQGDKNALVRLSRSVILGRNEFIEEIKTRYLRYKHVDRNLPTLRYFADRPGLSQIEKAVDSVLKTDKKLARRVKLYMFHQYSGMKLREIGEHFGLCESGVSQVSRRIGTQVEKDKKLREIIKTIETRIVLSNV
jgi:REP element-mobilizing transposase RayT